MASPSHIARTWSNPETVGSVGGRRLPGRARERASRRLGPVSLRPIDPRLLRQLLQPFTPS
jgi:hypothetical protein